MEYILNVCPICGCSDLKRISRTAVDGDYYNTYRCPACGETVSSEKKLRSAQEEKRHEAERQEAARLAEQKAKEEAKKKENTVKSAADIFAENHASVVEIIADKGSYEAQGTGMVLPNGYILSNAHIVFLKGNSTADLADRIIGKYSDGSIYELDLVYADIKKDIVLLQSENDKAKPITFSKSKVVTGERVYAIGNSKGQGICIMDGIVSDAKRTIHGEEYIMISVPISTGNSGGPLFNAKGEVIGMTTMGRNDAIMNYAISTSVLQSFICVVIEKESVDLDIKNF